MTACLKNVKWSSAIPAFYTNNPLNSSVSHGFYLEYRHFEIALVQAQAVQVTPADLCD